MDIHQLGKNCHPNLLRILGCCLKDRDLYLVHEFMEKRSLKDYLRNGTTFDFSLSYSLPIDFFEFEIKILRQ